MFGSYGRHNYRPASTVGLLVLGVLGMAFSFIFFLQKFNIVAMSFQITDITYMYFFAIFTFVAGVTMLFKALAPQIHY